MQLAQQRCQQGGLASTHLPNHSQQRALGHAEVYAVGKRSVSYHILDALSEKKIIAIIIKTLAIVMYVSSKSPDFIPSDTSNQKISIHIPI